MAFSSNSYPNCVVAWSNGEITELDAELLHLQGLDHWRGWKCFAGVNGIHITAELDVFDSECCNKKLGNLKSSWSLLDEPGRCSRDSCVGSVDSLGIKKSIF